MRQRPRCASMSIPANESASGDVADAEDSADAETSDQAFELEYQLRDFLAQNISSIDVDGRRLRVYVDPTGRDGIEFPTAVGPIDVLAIDASGDFYVFEVKRGSQSGPRHRPTCALMA